MLQFIDGRLAKLNEGRGFTDVFEEEITEGGFCGSEWDFLCLVEEKERTNTFMFGNILAG